MEKARQAVSDFVSKGGKHRTTVEESVAPAATTEHVRPHRHEEATTAIDREVHQHHHHTTVQPLSHQEVLPEEHSHNIIPVEEKTFEHGNDDNVKAKLEAEAAKFRDTSVTHDTTHTSSAAPVVESERVHHHVHEHVQPVVEKEVIQPKVVHTTVPIHEVHNATAQHHGTSTLPGKTLEEFKAAGGILDGNNSAHHGEYDGCPRPYNKSLQTEQTEADRSVHSHHHHGNEITGKNSLNNNSNRTGDLNNKTGNFNNTSSRTDNFTNTNNRTGDLNNNRADGYNNTTSPSTTSNASANGVGAGSKPSLAQRLNPLKDADHDGKKGFMD